MSQWIEKVLLNLFLFLFWTFRKFFSWTKVTFSSFHKAFTVSLLFILSNNASQLNFTALQTKSTTTPNTERKTIFYIFTRIASRLLYTFGTEEVCSTRHMHPPLGLHSGTRGSRTWLTVSQRQTRLSHSSHAFFKLSLIKILQLHNWPSTLHFVPLFYLFPSKLSVDCLQMFSCELDLITEDNFKLKFQVVHFWWNTEHEILR